MNLMRLVFQHSVSRWFISLAFVISAIITVSAKFAKQTATVYEYVMLMIADRLMLAVVITVPSLLLTVNLCKFSRWEMQAMLRLGNVHRWYLRKLQAALAILTLYVVILMLLMTAAGIITRHGVSANWQETYSYRHRIVLIDSFDRSGRPFGLLIGENVPPPLCLAVSALLLFGRCLSYSLFMLVVNLILHREIFGFAAAIALNYLEVNILFIARSGHNGFLPFVNSIVTGIDGIRPALGFSLFYWLAVISAFIFIGLHFAERSAEEMCLNIKSENMNNV